MQGRVKMYMQRFNEEEAKEIMTDKMQEDAQQETILTEAAEEVKIAHDPTTQEIIKQ